jgi:Domain of unknown function (DUF4278)
MKLNYCGNSYDVPAPSQPSSDAIDKPKIKLFYRGNTFDYIPRPEVVAEEDWPTVTLMYRGVTYKRKIQPPKLYQKPRAVNWRWQWT